VALTRLGSQRQRPAGHRLPAGGAV